MSGFVELSSPVAVYNIYWIDHILLYFNVYKGNTCLYQHQTLFMLFLALCWSSKFSECHIKKHFFACQFVSCLQTKKLILEVITRSYKTWLRFNKSKLMFWLLRWVKYYWMIASRGWLWCLYKLLNTVTRCEFWLASLRRSKCHCSYCNCLWLVRTRRELGEDSARTQSGLGYYSVTSDIEGAAKSRN